MRNLNADQLEAFVAVIEAGGFTNAARQLHLTQPAISLQIRELEARCGLRLIDRDGRSPKLTAAGEDLYQHARRILAEHRAAVTLMRRHRDNSTGRIRIGMSTTTLVHLAGPALRKVRADHPTLQILVDIGTSRPLSAAVAAGDLDLAIVTLPIAQTTLVTTPLYRDHLVAIFPASVPEPPAEITPDWLAGQPFIAEARASVLSEATRAWFASAQVEPDTVMRLGHLAAMQGAVEAGLGVRIVPQILLKDGTAALKQRPLRPAIPREVVIIERPDAIIAAVPLVKACLLETVATSTRPAAGHQS